MQEGLDDRSPSRMVAADRHPVNVLWLTSGLGCDGDSVAMTAATSPSFEDLIRGCFPGAPPLVIYNPLLAYETGDEFMRAWFDAAAGRLEPFILVLEGAVQVEVVGGAGHQTGLREPLQRVRDRRSLGGDQLPEQAVRERKRQPDAGRLHPPPAVG